MGALTFDDIHSVAQTGALTFDDLPVQKSRREMDFGERMAQNYQTRIGRMQESADAYVAGEQTGAETYAQQALQFAQLAPDVASEGFVSGFRALPDFIEQPIRQGASNVYSSVANTDFGRTVGDLASNVFGAYTDFAENNPRAARNIGAVGNLGNLALAVTPIKGQTIPSRVVSPVAQTVKTGVTAPIKAATKATVWTGAKAAGLLDDITENVASGISQTVNRTNIPKQFKSLPDAELLFVKTLTEEGVSIENALSSLKNAKAFKVSPSVGVTANIPQMQTQGYLMSRGSAGSRVAEQARQDILKNQIPKMNEEILKVATSGKKTAEQYGKDVFQAAKKAVDKRKSVLKTRATPYYQASVGLDKSVPLDDTFKKVLNNPLAVKALDDFRKDPFTLTNVQRELAELSVDFPDLQKLPYNSTISLHGARVHLRQLNDAAFAAGEGQKGLAIKTAMNQIDEAIEASFPQYAKARAIYSEDAGALKSLMDSPVGKMSKFSDADYSKIADNLMSKDPQFINKTISSFKKAGVNENKIREGIAGSFLRRKLEESAKDGIRFGDAVFKNEGTRNRLKALVGQEKFNKMEKANDVIEQLLQTKNIPSQSITAAAQSVKEGVSLPTDKAGLVDEIRKKIAPSLFEMVRRNPKQAARYNELLFTDEGFKLLEKLNSQKTVKWYEVDKIGSFLSKKIKEDLKK